MRTRWEVRYDKELRMWLARPVGHPDGTPFKRWRMAWDYARWAATPSPLRRLVPQASGPDLAEVLLKAGATEEQVQVFARVVAHGAFEVGDFLMLRERGIDLPEDIVTSLLFGDYARWAVRA